MSEVLLAKKCCSACKPVGLIFCVYPCADLAVQQHVRAVGGAAGEEALLRLQGGTPLLPWLPGEVQQHQQQR